MFAAQLLTAPAGPPPAQTAPHTARDIDVVLAPGETASLEISIASPWKLLRAGR